MLPTSLALRCATKRVCLLGGSVRGRLSRSRIEVFRNKLTYRRLTGSRGGKVVVVYVAGEPSTIKSICIGICI